MALTKSQQALIVIVLISGAVLICRFPRLFYNHVAFVALKEAAADERKPVSDFKFTELQKGEPDMYTYDSQSSPGLEIVVLVHWDGGTEISTWHPDRN